MVLKRYSRYFRIWISFTTKSRTLELETNQKILQQKFDEQQQLLEKTKEIRSDSGYAVGVKVQSNYRNEGKWYEAVITRKRKDGTYDVQYDDGDSEVKVSRSNIRIAEILEGNLYNEGFPVEANYQGRNVWFPGKIANVRFDGHYDILYDDGEREVAVKSSYIRNRVEPLVDAVLEKGMKVEGNYKGKGIWYPGKIIADHEDGTYDILYDDGEMVSDTGKSFLRPVIMQLSPQRKGALKKGEIVEANYKGRGKWYKGIISADRGDNTFDILYDDGESEIVNRDLIRSLQFNQIATVSEPIINTQEPQTAIETAQVPTEGSSSVDATTKAMQAFNLIQAAMGDNYNSFGLGSASRGVLDDIFKSTSTALPKSVPNDEVTETKAEVVEPVQVSTEVPTMTKEQISVKIENIKQEQLNRVNELLARFASEDEEDDYYDEDFERPQ